MPHEVLTDMLVYCKEQGITQKTILANNAEISERTVSSFFSGKMENATAATISSLARAIGLKIVATKDGETPLDKARFELELKAQEDRIAGLTSTVAELREENKAAAIEAEKQSIEVKWLRRCLRVCVLILGIVLLICIGVVLIDLLNHNVGWVRVAAQQLSGSSIYGTSVRL